MKILIVHPDSPNNRGDRAILSGSIKMLKDKWPQAEIIGFSENPVRDAEWMGIKFLKIPVQSVNPVNMMRTMHWARKSDMVLWGGGEIMKDYTNKLALWYWVVKMYLIYLVNKDLYGFYQGIGPTSATSSKKGIAFIVNRTKAFPVRDQESKDKLLNWGTKSPVIASYDTAIMDDPAPLDKTLESKLSKQYDIDSNFINNCTGFAPKAWFHYKHGGLLPYKYRHMFKPKIQETKKSKQLYQNIAELADYTVEKHDTNILFVPMHLSEGENDPGIARRVISLMKHSDRTRLIDRDELSPQELITVIGRCKAFVGVRLHSTILATIASVPTLVFYYVDKGRLFFKQTDMERFSYPVESLIEENMMPEFKSKIDSLFTERDSIRATQSDKIAMMKKDIRATFDNCTDTS